MAGSGGQGQAPGAVAGGADATGGDGGAESDEWRVWSTGSPGGAKGRGRAESPLRAANKTLLALLCDLVVLLVLSAVTRLARNAALGFVSDSKRRAPHLVGMAA